MSVELSCYRYRIGIFGPGRGRKMRQGKFRYSSTTSGPDIHLRALIMSLTFLLVFYATDLSLHIHKTCFVNGQYEPSNFIKQSCDYPTTNQPTYGVQGSLKQAVVLNTFGYFSQMKLVLSADIESNPGPDTKQVTTSSHDKGSEDRILAAIQESRETLSNEIATVKLDVKTIKGDLDNINAICKSVQEQMTSIKQKQDQLDKRQKSQEDTINTIQQEKENLQLDVDEVHTLLEENTDRINKLEDNFEKLDKQSRSKNIRIFGLDPSKSSLCSLKSLILNSVLKVAYPDAMLNENEIADAHYVGKTSSVAIVTLWSTELKYDLFRKRDVLRKNGIRLSEDLTINQRSKLNTLKEQGHTGYFFKGELKIREERHNRKDQSRQFINARRRVLGATNDMDTNANSTEYDDLTSTSGQTA